ncbi:ABC transporter related [Gluconacetobacter diazotrophicus PA1 5]|uniref:Cell division ATP-binding protein FtsE n=2 Tax=Gluconacetobacter diazotrophicus TaxID=33996 RepID=A9HPJ7_GLUDA|nr:ATP-binding cassette domain-containing protein [Gluconacetobacter diazotrophicus]ACI50658.1 ABC transporter related [Gluconacetobacter diazotrophicus PA1 5]MBB2157474.1 ATP-binding cassette domain-containing protein [Gluconacetobacter diazotrophicus]TWB09490.1 D-methionine transport system ATP-binding protein [Gluconacetobacter diazotrophicus]CAP56598.1 putative D-methionine transport ATP-binding protein metN [Gluconacetobacter diazotrophicus PA1 5]
MSLLRVEHASRRFAGHTALQDIDFEVHPGEILGVIGRSGAGKTTLLRCLSGLERPDSGRIVIEGEDITALPESRLVQVRRRIGLVFQHFNLLQSRTVAGNVALPLEIAGVPKAARAARVAELIELVGLSGHKRKRPSQLSGGQKQRVGIARALAAQPALLLCDEATSALDPETTVSILDLLLDINRRLGLTIILITHEMEVIRRIARRVLVLDQGRIVEDGPTAALLGGATRHPVTRAFLSEGRPRVPDDVMDALRDAPSQGAHPVLHVVLDAPAGQTPLLSTLGRRFGLDVTVVQATVGDISGRAGAEFVLRLSDQSAEALDFIRQASQSMEVIGYVPADR